MHACIIEPERAQTRLHLLVLGDVVRAEHVDDPIEPSLELVLVIGDVGKAVGRLARALDDHLVFGEPERSQAEPLRAVFVVDHARGAKIGENTVDGAVLVKRVLVEVNVEADAHALERRLDVGEDRALRMLLERLVIADIGQGGAVLRLEVGGDLADVVPLVPVLGKARRQTEPLEVAGTHRLAEYLHLAPSVVEVVLAHDLVTARLE